MIRGLSSSRRRFGSGTSLVVTFAADDVTPTALRMPARLRAREMSQLLAAICGLPLSALALPPVQLRSHPVEDSLRITEDGEELLSLRSLLAYHCATERNEEPPPETARRLAELVRRCERKGLISSARHGEGAEEEFVAVGSLGSLRGLGTYLPRSIVTNAHFFVILPGEAQGHHAAIGDPVGLTARGGSISRPPVAGRAALLRTRKGWTVERPGPERLEMRLPSGRVVRDGKDGVEILMSGPGLPGGRTPAGSVGLEVTLVGRWPAGLARSGGRPVPHGALVVRLPVAIAEPELEAFRRGAHVEYRLLGLDDLETAVQAGPLLVEDGRVCIDDDSFALEEFHLQGSAEPTIPTVFPTDASRTAAARLGVGVAEDGTLLIAAVEGKSALHRDISPGSSGCTLAELAEVLIEMGAGEAVNLDGGGSLQVCAGSGAMLTGADSRGVPGASFERPVPSALVFA